MQYLWHDNMWHHPNVWKQCDWEIHCCILQELQWCWRYSSLHELYPPRYQVSAVLRQTALLRPLNALIILTIEWLDTMSHYWREFFSSVKLQNVTRASVDSVVGSENFWENYAFRRIRQRRELEMFRWRPVDQLPALFIIQPYMQARLCHRDKSVCEGLSTSCSRAPSDIKAVPKHCTCQPLSSLLHAAAKTKCPPARFFFFFF